MSWPFNVFLFNPPDDGDPAAGGRDVERASSELVPLLDGGSVLDEDLADLEVSAGAGVVEGVPTACVALLDVGALAQEVLHNVQLKKV